MKNRDFRAMRREEKKRKFEAKQLARERDRKRLLEERQKKAAAKREEQQEMPTQFVGRLEYSRRGGIVFVDSKWLHDNIVVSAPDMGGAKEGDKVVVRLLRKGSKRALPEGEVIDVLGQDGENDTEMHAILAEYGLPYSYPKEIEEEAEKIDAGITPEEVKRRRDMRDTLTFTIDPRDAKDFDDAISFRRIDPKDSDAKDTDSAKDAKTADSGVRYEVGVHIADVTHYVRPHTAINDEGYARGTSVYLVDRTVPMLPEHLSNGICSLRPDEDKLTFSVVFILDAEANVKKYDICRTVTRSDHRYCYEEAQAIIEKDPLQSPKGEEKDVEGKERKEGTAITPSHGRAGESLDDRLQEALWTLNRLAKHLRQRRFEKGAIAFDRDEVAFEIDENGKPLSVYFKTSEDANKLIEEMMLLANRTVATYVGKMLQKPFVYRIHDLPDPDKLKDLSAFIHRFGYNLKTGSTRKETVSKNINSLLNGVKGKPEENLITTVAVRAMAKAVYSTENIGHYGLAFPYYTHFTSPIRRYPDMMVHRLLERYLAGGSPVDEGEYEEYCRHCSSREQLAAAAERASIKYKQVEFMQDKLGQEFDGVISGVTEWGIYVELTDNRCEGLVPIRELLPADYYDYIEKEFCIRGERTGHAFTLGDPIRVRIERADLSKKQLDFAIVEKV